ncbi:unnamed protein product, partial [Meganyctiphanes norvegica]
MLRLNKGRFGYVVRVVSVSQSRWARQKLRNKQDQQQVLVPVIRYYSSLRYGQDLLKYNVPNYAAPTRGIGMLVVRVLRGALKIRYLILGGTVASGGALAKV